MKNFKISVSTGEGIIFTEVEGERITIGKEKAFIFYTDFHKWNVSHLETGMRMASNADRDQAIKDAEHKAIKYPEAIEKGRDICKSLGIILPVNI